MTSEEFAKARRALMRRDPVLAPVIKKHRTRSPLDTPVTDPFSALVRRSWRSRSRRRPRRRFMGGRRPMPDGIVTPDAIPR
jgi:hypothetical protein